MKKAICALIAVLTLSVSLASCNLDRKLEGVEIKFQQKIASATEFSFNAALSMNLDGEKSDINVKCYKKGNEYAYIFGDKNEPDTTYRRLYADGKLYEFLTKPVVMNVDSGSYYTKDNVSISDSENFLYHLVDKILMATYATLLLSGTKDNVNGKEAYRYDISVDGNTYNLWYDDENLVKIAATLNSTDGSGNAHSDKYEAVFTDYLFKDISDSPFTRPSDMPITYVESPISFESWISIFGAFGNMSAAWLS